jgi:hypothetical protein
MGLSGQLHAQAALTPEKILGSRFARDYLGPGGFLELLERIFFFFLPNCRDSIS